MLTLPCQLQEVYGLMDINLRYSIRTHCSCPASGELVGPIGIQYPTQEVF